MEFVAADGEFLFRRKDGSLLDFRFHVAEALQAVGHGEIEGEIAGEGAGLPFVSHGLPEVDIAAALSVTGHSVVELLSQAFHERFVGGKGVQIQLRIAAAKVEAVNLGNSAVGQRAERHDLRAQLFQKVKAVLIVEVKGRVTGYADLHLFR